MKKNAKDEREIKKELEAYRERMAGHECSEEERCEMEAAFGKGTTVVNVLTGQKIKL